MAWSKRKPYVYDEDTKTPAGRIRSSLGDFFRAQVRHLKESNEKESQFEKPYRGGSYNKMHLDLPWPEFRRYEDPEPGSIFGAMPSLMHTFFFGPGTCSFTGGGELTVGVPKGVSGFMALTPPQSAGGEWRWSVSSSRAEVSVDIKSHGKSPTIRVTASSEFEGIALVCGSCSYSGSLVTSYTMEKAGPGFVTLNLVGNQINFIDQNTNLPAENIQTAYGGGGALACGCVEFTCNENKCEDVVPVTFLDYGTNPETIARSSSVTLTVQDGLAPYSWSVSGTGFSIPGTTSGLSNLLSADGTACGAATVTVTDDCGNSDSYEVRCNEGNWSSAVMGCVLSGSSETSGRTLRLTRGKIQQYHEMYLCGSTVSCTGGDTPCSYLCDNNGSEVNECLTTTCLRVTGNSGGGYVEGYLCCPISNIFRCYGAGETGRSKYRYFTWEC